MTPIDDATVEGSERVTLSLTPFAGYTLGPPASGGTVTLYDDDHIARDGRHPAEPPAASPTTAAAAPVDRERERCRRQRQPRGDQLAAAPRVQLQTRNTAPREHGRHAGGQLLGPQRQPQPAVGTVPARVREGRHAVHPVAEHRGADGGRQRAWTFYSFAFRAAETYDATTNRAQLGFQLGFDPQTVEIGGVAVKNYGTAVSPADVRRVGQTYQGRTAGDSAWRGAEDRIGNGKGDLAVTVRDAAGRPLEGRRCRCGWSSTPSASARRWRGT